MLRAASRRIALQRNATYCEPGLSANPGKLCESQGRLCESRVRDHAVHLGLNISSFAHNCGCTVDGGSYHYNSNLSVTTTANLKLVQ